MKDCKVPYWALETDLKRWKIGDEVQVDINTSNASWAGDWHDIKLTIIGIKWSVARQRVEITCHDGYAETDEFSADDFVIWM